MTGQSETKPDAASESASRPRTKPDGEVRARWGWTEQSVWTNRMLTALEPARPACLPRSLTTIERRRHERKRRDWKKINEYVIPCEYVYFLSHSELFSSKELPIESRVVIDMSSPGTKHVWPLEMIRKTVNEASKWDEFHPAS